MARIFVRANDTYLERLSNFPVTDTEPSVFVSWVKPILGYNACIMALGYKNVSAQNFNTQHRAGAGFPNIRTYYTSGSSLQISVNAMIEDSWNILYSAFLPGIPKIRVAGNDSSINEGNGYAGLSQSINSYRIGANASTTEIGFHGIISDVAIWALSDFPGATEGDKANYFQTHIWPGLRNRMSPLFFPLGLRSYVPMGGITDLTLGNERDIIAGVDMVPNSTTGVTLTNDSPGLIYPSTPTYFLPTEVGPPVTIGNVDPVSVSPSLPVVTASATVSLIGQVSTLQINPNLFALTPTFGVTAIVNSIQPTLILTNTAGSTEQETIGVPGVPIATPSIPAVSGTIQADLTAAVDAVTQTLVLPLVTGAVDSDLVGTVAPLTVLPELPLVTASISEAVIGNVNPVSASPSLGAVSGIVSKIIGTVAPVEATCSLLSVRAITDKVDVGFRRTSWPRYPTIWH